MVGIGSIWLRIGTGGGLMWAWWWTSGFHKMLGSSRVAAQLAASQEGLSSMSEWATLSVEITWNGSVISEWFGEECAKKCSWPEPRIIWMRITDDLVEMWTDEPPNKNEKRYCSTDFLGPSTIKPKRETRITRVRVSSVHSTFQGATPSALTLFTDMNKPVTSRRLGLSFATCKRRSVGSCYGDLFEHAVLSFSRHVAPSEMY
jgi:hypothetical protein